MKIQMTPEVTSKDRFQVAHLPDFHISRESDPHPCLAWKPKALKLSLALGCTRCSITSREKHHTLALAFSSSPDLWCFYCRLKIFPELADWTPFSIHTLVQSFLEELSSENASVSITVMPSCVTWTLTSQLHQGHSWSQVGLGLKPQ